MRKYKCGTVEREIRFEHALVSHIRRNGFDIAARGVREQGTASTFVTREEMLDGEPVTRFFAVYEMLAGEDKYTWIKNRCTDAEYRERGPRPGALPPRRPTTSNPATWCASSRP